MDQGCVGFGIGFRITIGSIWFRKYYKDLKCIFLKIMDLMCKFPKVHKGSTFANLG